MATKGKVPNWVIRVSRSVLSTGKGKYEGQYKSSSIARAQLEFQKMGWEGEML